MLSIGIRQHQTISGSNAVPTGAGEKLYREERKKSEVSQSYPTLCDPMDCSLPGFSIHGFFQARSDRTQVSHTVDRCFTSEPPGKPFREKRLKQSKEIIDWL